jgi:hypothetical protein
MLRVERSLNLERNRNDERSNKRKKKATRPSKIRWHTHAPRCRARRREGMVMQEVLVEFGLAGRSVVVPLAEFAKR